MLRIYRPSNAQLNKLSGIALATGIVKQNRIHRCRWLAPFRSQFSRDYPPQQPATEVVQENALVQLLQTLTAGDTQGLLHGIGDDAAVLDGDGNDWVATTDLIADGTHFLSGQATPEQIGRKAMAVNLSDIAAMAAEPVAAFVSLLLPNSTTNEYPELLMKAMICLLYTSPSPRDKRQSRMPSSA